jgi:NodT family efflux transporter outer membrane factor (OMF) lipoprotein
MRSLLSLALAVVAMALGTGCVVGPSYQQPALDAPETFLRSAQASDAPAEEASATPPAVDLAEWWKSLNDPLLDELIAAALEANYDLQAAAARLRVARAQRGAIDSDFWPDLDASAGYQATRDSLTGPAGQAAGESFDRTSELYRAGFDASWELDVFGRVQRSAEAADAEIGASLEDARDIQVTLLAEVASNYIALREFQQRLALTQQNLDAQRQSADLTRQRYEAGLAPELDLARAKAQVAATEALLPALRQEASLRLHRLGALTAIPLTELAPRLEAVQDIPAPGVVASAGLPAELLRRRPDLRRAERRLAAATARIGVATADYYPRFRLVGNLGWTTTSLGDLDPSDSLAAGIGPSVSWAILNLRRVEFQIEAADARAQEALASYKGTLLRAVEEVENALVSLEREAERAEALERAAASNRRALELARLLYREGRSSFLDVLDSERALLDAENMLASSRARVSTSAVALYKALGGGWDRMPAAASA